MPSLTLGLLADVPWGKCGGDTCPGNGGTCQLRGSGMHQFGWKVCRVCIWVFPRIGGFPPKWMVKIMENPIKMDDLGGTIIFGNTHMSQVSSVGCLFGW